MPMTKSRKRSKHLPSLAAAFLAAIPFFFHPMDGLQAATTLATYANPSGGVTTNTTFTVKVRANGGAWQDLDEYQTTIGGYTPAQASFVYFDCDGPVDVSVTCNSGTVTSAAIRPLSSNVVPIIVGNTLTFTIPGPQKLSVEVNGDIYHNLHLFANPIDTNPPSPSDPNVIYLGPGVYNQNYNVPSGKTLYIAGGAVVKGAVNLDNSVNAKLLGRGILDHPSGRAISVDNSSGITIDGIIVNVYGAGDNGGCLTNVGNSSNVSINNLKGFAYQKWTDGIDVFTSTNTTINDCFIRSGDDCIAVYGARQNSGHIYWGDVRGVTVTNCTLFPDVAHPINLGTHGDPLAPGGGESLDSLSFSNLDILEHNAANTHVLPIGFSCGDGNLITNTTFTDIRIEDSSAKAIFEIRTILGGYNTAAGRGINNIYFKNIAYTGTNNGSAIVGYDTARMTRGITFENLTVNGSLVLSAGAGNINVGSYTDAIQFVGPGGGSYSPIPIPAVVPPVYSNLALAGTASTDSALAASPASNGNDGNTDTVWTAGDSLTGHWWTLDLGANRSITGGTKVTWPQGGRLYSYQIDVSTDNATWVKKIDKTVNNNSAQTQSDYFVANTRYVRITILGLPTGVWAGFCDFQVLGFQAGATLSTENNYGGTALVLAPGTYTSTFLSAAGMANDTVSSLRIPEGLKVDLYQNGNLDGMKWTYTTSDPVLNDTGANDQTSSLVVSRVNPVNLAASFNEDGFSGDLNRAGGNYDGYGYSYPVELVDGATTYGNVYFQLGPMTEGSNNSVRCLGQTVTLPQGSYSTLWFLGSATNRDQTGTFVINYADGTVSTVNITETDWSGTASNGAEAFSHRHSSAGDDPAHAVRIFAYSLAPVPGKTVTGLQLPINANMHVLALSLVAPHASQIGLVSRFNEDGFSYDTNRADGNFDGHGYTYPAELVNTPQTYHGVPFQLGPLSDGSSNSIHCAGQTITIPPGPYSSIRFLGSGSNGDQTGTFVINYTDGTNSTVVLTEKNWCSTASNAAVTLAHRHGPTADDQTNTPSLFAYTLVPTADKVVSGVQLPTNSNIHVFAMTGVQ